LTKRKRRADDTTEDKALSLEQYLKYAADLAELYESELAKRMALEATNKELQREIAKRRRLELELMESERKYRSLFEDSRDPIFMTNRPGRLVHANDAFMELLGYTEEEIIGESMLKIYADPTLRGAFRQEVEAKGSLKDFEMQVVKKDGTIVDCLITASLRFSEDGRILGYQGIIRDVTEQKRSEQLRHQAKRMEALSRLAGNIAHQIRNPLAISSSAAQLLMTRELHPVLRAECAGKIVSGIRRAALIVENLLAYVQPLRKSEMTSTEVVPLVREALGQVAHEAANLHVEISFAADQGSLSVEGNVQLLIQALVNLLTISFGSMEDGGKAAISAKRNGPDAVVTISNTGQGLQGQRIDEVLDPFFSDTTRVTDLELALSVSHAIVSQHGGRINVRNAAGQGTTFEVVLPARP
jgi:PAS domain S-box-containing protein